MIDINFLCVNLQTEKKQTSINERSTVIEG